MPEVKVYWYDGGLMPPRPEELKDGQMMGDENGGIIFIGTKGRGQPVKKAFVFSNGSEDMEFLRHAELSY